MNTNREIHDIKRPNFSFKTKNSGSLLVNNIGALPHSCSSHRESGNIAKLCEVLLNSFRVTEKRNVTNNCGSVSFSLSIEFEIADNNCGLRKFRLEEFRSFA